MEKRATGRAADGNAAARTKGEASGAAAQPKHSAQKSRVTKPARKATRQTGAESGQAAKSFSSQAKAAMFQCHKKGASAGNQAPGTATQPSAAAPAAPSHTALFHLPSFSRGSGFHGPSRKTVTSATAAPPPAASTHRSGPALGSHSKEQGGKEGSITPTRAATSHHHHHHSVKTPGYLAHAAGREELKRVLEKAAQRLER